MNEDLEAVIAAAERLSSSAKHAPDYVKQVRGLIKAMGLAPPQALKLLNMGVVWAPSRRKYSMSIDTKELIAKATKLASMKRALPPEAREAVAMLCQASYDPHETASERLRLEERLVIEALAGSLPPTQDDLAALAVTDNDRFKAIMGLEESKALPWFDLDEMPVKTWEHAVRPPVPRGQWPTTIERYIALKPEERAKLEDCIGFKPEELDSIEGVVRREVLLAQTRGEVVIIPKDGE